MTTLRDGLLPVFDTARGLMQGFGLRTSTVAVRTRSWTGALGPPNLYSDSDLLLVPTPRVRQLSSKEIDGSGGEYQNGDVRVDKVTPSYAGGGYTRDRLVPVASALVEVFYVITGPLDGDYKHVSDGFDRNFGYSLVLRRLNRTP